VVDDVERPLGGGWVTAGVVRVGGTVRRPQSSNAAFVELLLAHLEAAAFDAAPRHLGTDERGRQVLTFIEGEVPSDCRALVWADGQLEAMAALLRRFHDATGSSGLSRRRRLSATTTLAPGTSSGATGCWWRSSTSTRQPRVAGRTTSGYAVWKALNLGLIDVPVAEQRRRTLLYARAYGAAADSCLRHRMGPGTNGA
jgi:hypothetical protein